MLTISSGYDPLYLTRAVATGRENYYLSAVAEQGEPPGIWSGRGCPELGLQIGSEVDNRLTDLGTENVASKKYTAARWSFSACMMSWSRRSGVASGSAASRRAISVATLSLLPAKLLGARPRVAVPLGSRGSANSP